VKHFSGHFRPRYFRAPVGRQLDGKVELFSPRKYVKQIRLDHVIHKQISSYFACTGDRQYCTVLLTFCRATSFFCTFIHRHSRIIEAVTIRTWLYVRVHTSLYTWRREETRSKRKRILAKLLDNVINEMLLIAENGRKIIRSKRKLLEQYR